MRTHKLSAVMQKYELYRKQSTAIRLAYLWQVPLFAKVQLAGFQDLRSLDIARTVAAHNIECQWFQRLNKEPRLIHANARTLIQRVMQTCKSDCTICAPKVKMYLNIREWNMITPEHYSDHDKEEAFNITNLQITENMPASIPSELPD